MEYAICMILGYLLGCLNPSYFISKIKNIDLRTKGTENLGATNTYMIFGKRYGTFVLVFDILKALLAVKMAGLLFPELVLSGVVAGASAIVGHIFPFYIGFKGGKGVASLGGLVLGLDWRCFLLLLLVGLILAVIFNWGCCISFSASVLFPVLYSLKMHNPASLLILGVGSICIIYKHMENIKKIKNGRELPIRDFLRQHLWAGKI